MIRWDDDGTATIRVRLPTDEAAEFVAGIEERLRKMEQPPSVPWDARRARGLAELVADGASVIAPNRAGPLVHIIIPLADLEAGRSGTIGGRPIADATVRRMLCDGSVIGVVVDENGPPCPPAPVPGSRQLASAGSSTCATAGCAPMRGAAAPPRTSITSDTGSTAAAPPWRSWPACCRSRHQAHHQGQCGMGIDPQTGAIRFTRPDGTAILDRAVTAGGADDVPARSRPNLAPSPPVGTAARSGSAS